MAFISVSGLDSLIADIGTLASKSPAMRDRMLEAEANVIEPAIRNASPHRSGRLSESIKRLKRGATIRIRPVGEHHRYVPVHGSGIVTAGYVGYINEYGLPSRGISAREWMGKAVSKNEAAALAAAEREHDKFLKECNL